MKASILVRVLCGLLMVFFLGSSTDEGCDNSTSTDTAQLIVNNYTSSGFTVSVAGRSEYLGSGDSTAFSLPPDATYTVTTSTGVSKSVYVGYTSASVTFS